MFGPRSVRPSCSRGLLTERPLRSSWLGAFPWNGPAGLGGFVGGSVRSGWIGFGAESVCRTCHRALQVGAGPIGWQGPDDPALLEQEEPRPRGASPGSVVRWERVEVAPRSRIDRRMALLRGVSIDPGRVEVAPPQNLDSDPWHRCPFGRWALWSR